MRLKKSEVVDTWWTLSGCLLKRECSNQLCSNERPFHSWPSVRKRSPCDCVFVFCMLIPLWRLVWIMQPTGSLVSQFEWLFKPEQALIMHARMCVIPDPHSPSGTDRLGGNHGWAMMKAVIGAHTKHDTDESSAPTCRCKRPPDWPALVNNKTGSRGKAEWKRIDLLLLRKNQIVCFVFSPSFGFSALDRQPSERVFYRSQGAHRLTAHDPQHWMMNGERRPSHPSQLRPLRHSIHLKSCSKCRQPARVWFLSTISSTQRWDCDYIKIIVSAETDNRNCVSQSKP